jgi:hypothetical protein
MSKQHSDAEEIEHLNEQCDIFVREINENAVRITQLREQIASLQASSGYELSIAQLEIAWLRAALGHIQDGTWNRGTGEMIPPSEYARRALKDTTP